MSAPNIFDFETYLEFLKDALKRGLFGSRGPKSRLAEAAGCQVAYVSQVLNGQAMFSVEQANGIGNYLKLSDEERSYFFDLVLHARAGTKDVASFYRKRLLEIRQKRLELSKRLANSSKIALEHRATYYSAWYYAAVHMLIHIRKYRTVEAISDRLRLEHSLVQKILQGLLAIDVVKQDGAYYSPNPSDFHLSKGSPFLNKHLFNWRLKAMLAVDEGNQGGLHYSCVMSLNAEDALAIKEILTRSIEKSRQITSESEGEESIFVCNMDFFEL